MALNRLRIYFYILGAALVLSACAKRDSEFKARKNASGATYVGVHSEAADAAAAAAGYDTDILAVTQPQTIAGGVSVMSYLKVNTYNYKVTTTHTSVGTVSTVRQNLNGADFEINAVCATAECNPYYLVINITRGGQPIKQTAMKKYFWYSGSADSSQDLIMSNGPGEFLPVQSAIATLDQYRGESVNSNYMYTKAQ